MIVGLNRLAGAPLIDLFALFARIDAEGWGMWWLWIMVFTTLVPTALHVLLSLMSVQAAVPAILRRRIARLVRRAETGIGPAIAAPPSVGLGLTLPVVLLAAVLLGLWRIVPDLAAWAGGWYLDRLWLWAFWLDG